MIAAAAEAKDRNAVVAVAAERQRDAERQTAVRDAEAEKSILRAQLALVRSENATQNADRAQQRMRRRLAEQRAEEQRQVTRRADRDSRRRRLDNAITFSAADTLATRGIDAYAERGQPDGGRLVDLGHLAKTSPVLSHGELSPMASSTVADSARGVLIRCGP